MVWALLALVGVPLLLCALVLLVVVPRNRRLRKRRGDVPVRFRAVAHKRWIRGHSVRVHDVVAFRGSPAAWRETLLETTHLAPRPASPEELPTLHRLGDAPVVVDITLRSGDRVTMAASAADAPALLHRGERAPLPVIEPLRSLTPTQ